MREIKFRAWDLYREEMFYEVGVHPHISEAHHLDPDAGYKDGEESWTLNPSSTPFPIMQFTGLHDKNGRAIYEGDIYKTESRNGPYVVTFLSGAFCGGERISNSSPLGWDDEGDDEAWVASDVEIVGNIYQNPELLTNK
jgi:uncharacterized phage protein (TIGR01671 family)